MQAAIEAYYLEMSEPNRSCLLALRSILLNADQKVVETWKWSMPCFCYGKKMFCFLRIDKDTDRPYILWVEGKRLTHPDLEEGNRSRMKVFRIDPNEDLPIADIALILKQALAVYQS